MSEQHDLNPDPLGEYGPEQVKPETKAKPRNKVPTAKYIAYELPGDPETHTCRPAPSSKRHDETEDEWLERTRLRFVPADAVNVRILSD
jgi:hypothetical protein